ncbi:extracellular solute-binding protein [Actinosynnema sp. NPDC020468]|uniref:ABC transporter substrate-binding protein n=1 Tax=Actinosynnema sp. NPDC020468 TaxID=3154488 RepID=UPI003403B276
MRVRALLVVVAMALGACGSGPVTTGEVLTWWDSYSTEPGSAAVETVLTRFEQQHPGVDVRRTSFGRDELRKRVDEAVTSGGLPDVAVVDTGDVARLAPAVVDLTARYGGWDSKLLDPVRRGVVVDGKSYGVPVRASTLALVRNRELVPEPPSTWDELRSVARGRTSGERAGLCFAGAGDALASGFLPVLWQAGGDVRDVGGAAGVAALSFVDGLRTDGSVPAGVADWDDAAAAEAFSLGRCAMLLAGPEVTPSANLAGLDWVSGPLPGGVPAPVRGETGVIGRGSAHVDLAWRLLTWVSDTRDNSTQLGGVLYALPDRADTVTDLGWQWDPNVAGFAEQLRASRPMAEYGPNYPRIATAVAAAARDVLEGRKAPAAAAEEAGRVVGPLTR